MMAPVRTVILTMFLLLIISGKADALDEFAGIKCGGNIPKALVGTRVVRERVVVLEQRHKDLELEDLGGTEISDRLFLISWRICGAEYEVLINTKTRLISDVLAFPPHSASAPMLIGTCQAAGMEIREAVVAVLDNRAGYNARNGALARTMLNATAAWRIDERKEKFLEQSTDGLTCPLGEIVTLDNGP